VKVRGTFHLDAPREDVFRAIRDPGTLLAVIPGCESIEQVGPDEYRGRLTLRLPGVAGSYRTWVRLVDASPPERAGLQGRLEGGLGSIRGDAEFSLADDTGTTIIDYHGQGLIDGPLARLDSRFAERLAETLIAQALQTLDARLARPPAGSATGSVAQPATEVSE
jgi:uncharacterized protein